MKKNSRERERERISLNRIVVDLTVWGPKDTVGAPLKVYYITLISYTSSIAMSMFVLVFESRSSGCPEELLWRFHGLENPSVVGSSGSTSSVVIESLNCEINENSIRGDPFVSLSQRLRPKFFFFLSLPLSIRWNFSFLIHKCDVTWGC